MVSGMGVNEVGANSKNKQAVLAAAVLLIATTMTFTSAVTRASDVQAMNQKVDEMDLAKEIEDVEQYGEAAAAEETRRENQRLALEARRKEHEIKMANGAVERAKSKAKKLEVVYQQRARVAQETEARARVAEREKNRAESVVSRLRTKVEDKNRQVVHSINRRKQSEMDYARLKWEKKNLERRMLIAQRTIRMNELRRRQIRNKLSQLMSKNRKLSRKVVRLEDRARASY